MREKGVLIGLLLFGFSLLLPVSSTAALISVQPHLWLAADPAAFADYEGSPDYVGSVSDPWYSESMVTSGSFNLFIYNASHSITAYDVGLIMTVHSGETGSLTIGDTTYSLFPNSGVPADTNLLFLHYSPHGVWAPADDGVWTSETSSADIAPLGYIDFGAVSWTGFSMVHFDAFSSISLDMLYALSENDFPSVTLLKNPYSHDLTAVPEPGTLALLSCGLLGMASWGRKKIRK